MVVNVIQWKPYNRGESKLEFFDRQGKGFTGKLEDFLKEHRNDLSGFKNKTTGMVLLLNHYGGIAARTPNKKGG